MTFTGAIGAEAACSRLAMDTLIVHLRRMCADWINQASSKIR